MTVLPDDELTLGIARFWSEDGEVTGSGFLVAGTTLCTCAHVVARALGTDEAEPSSPASPVTVDFPLLSPVASPPLRATVTHWRPVTEDGGGDIALLTLEAPVPGTTPVRFAGGGNVWDHPFRVLGFPQRTGDYGVWVQGRLRAPVGKGWTSMETRESYHGPAIGQGFSGAPVWDTGEGGVVGMTVAADGGSGATTAYLIPAALLLGLEPALRPCPFRGLEPFREQDAAVFFARRADSERIAAALRTTPFVPVAGASGVGKSSLVRAGVLPLLRAAGHTVTDFVGQPDADPVRALAATLSQQFPGARSLVPELCAPEGRRVEAAVLTGARVLEQAGPAGHVILLDQFEETVGTRPAEARALLDVLLPMTRATHPGGGRLRVLATLRSASLEELVAGGRAEELSGTVQMVGPLDPEQLDEIVRKPVDAIPGVEFQPGLAERVVADAGSESGALPLVEFALAELWERQAHGRLTHAAYREIGGVEGALSRYADHQLAEVCKAPGGPDESVARRLFERLVRPAKGREFTRVACGFEHLPPELRTAAQSLARTRLLVIGRDSSGRETVALAHEALVRQWPTLRCWLDESRAFLVWHEKLRGRLREWDAGGRQNDLLLRGQELSEARPMAALRPGELSGEEVEFMRLSRAHRRRSVRRSRTAVALLACLALMAGGLGYSLWRLYQDQGERKRNSAAERLVKYADEHADGSPVDAALVALAARRTSDTLETRAALMRYELPLSSLLTVQRLFAKDAGVVSVAAPADGHRMAVLRSGSGGVQAFVVSGPDSDTVRPTPLPGSPKQADAVAVSDDGTKIAAAAASGEVRVWNVGKGKWAAVSKTLSWSWDRGQGKDRESGTKALDFSRDGQWLLHFVDLTDSFVCEGDDLGDWVRLVKVDERAMKGQGKAPPEGMVKPEECLYDAALRSDQNNRVTLISGTKEPVLGSRERATRFAVRTGSPSTGRIEREQLDLDQQALVGDGRTLATVRQGEQVWQSRLAAPRGKGAKGQWPTHEDFETDATGQFLISAVSGAAQVASGPDDSHILAHDLVTGRRYSAVLPMEAIAANAVMVREARGTPLLYYAIGRDLLVFRTHAERQLLGDDLGTPDARDYAPRNHAMVALLGAPEDANGVAGRASVAVADAKGSRHAQLRAAYSEGSVVASEDGSSLVVWDSDGWELRSATDGLNWRAGQASPMRNGEPIPGSAVHVQDVQRYGLSDFLLLDHNGLSVLDGKRGRRTPLGEPDCEWTAATNQPACVTAIGRPDHPRELLVLRANGVAALWHVKHGHAAKKGVARFGSLPDDQSYTGVPAAFRSDGDAVAVTTRDGVSVWRPGYGDPTTLAADLEVRGPYDARACWCSSRPGTHLTKCGRTPRPLAWQSYLLLQTSIPGSSTATSCPERPTWARSTTT